MKAGIVRMRLTARRISAKPPDPVQGDAAEASSLANTRRTPRLWLIGSVHIASKPKLLRFPHNRIDPRWLLSCRRELMLNIFEKLLQRIKPFLFELMVHKLLRISVSSGNRPAKRIHISVIGYIVANHKVQSVDTFPNTRCRLFVPWG